MFKFRNKRRPLWKYDTFPQGTGLKIPLHIVGDGIWSLFCMIFRYLVYQSTKKFQNLKEMWLKTGTKKKNDLMRYISINKICESLDESLTNLLPALQSMTGCDSVSSFADISRIRVQLHMHTVR